MSERACSLVAVMFTYHLQGCRRGKGGSGGCCPVSGCSVCVCVSAVFLSSVCVSAGSRPPEPQVHPGEHERVPSKSEYKNHSLSAIAGWRGFIPIRGL